MAALTYKRVIAPIASLQLQSADPTPAMATAQMRGNRSLQPMTQNSSALRRHNESPPGRVILRASFSTPGQFLEAFDPHPSPGTLFVPTNIPLSVGADVTVSV